MKFFSQKLSACLLTAATLTCFTAPASAVSIYDDAVAYWSFDEASGTAYDGSLTASIDLEYQGTAAVTRVKSVLGNAVRIPWAAGAGNFLTTNGDVDALDLDRDEDFTVASWINLTDNENAIASKMVDGGTYRGWWFYVSWDDKLEFLLRSENDPNSRLWIHNTSEAIVQDEWIHVAVTFSYDSEDSLLGVRMYINGEEDLLNTSVREDGLSTWEETSNDRSFNVFGRDDKKRGYGLVDEQAIWKRVLSASEIAEIYSMGCPLPGDANLDGTVDEGDAAILAENWLMSTSGENEIGWAEGDFNEDGVVNDIDATMMAGNWLLSKSTSAGAVPEPSVLVLLIGGLSFALAIFSGQRRRNCNR